MTKRSSNFEKQTKKKVKLDEDIEALWGDDLDDDVLNDCIKLASQLCEQEKIINVQLNNVTLLPTYNAFKDQNAIFTSTQRDNTFMPSTSRRAPVNNKENDLEEYKKLKEKCEEKEGEVAILRSQLQEVKTSILIEQQKSQLEWKNKLCTTEREMKSVKSELEFKNLEIANLKQKVLDITKHTNMDVSMSTQNIPVLKDKKENKNVVEKIKTKQLLQAILMQNYPLKNVISDEIFSVNKREQHVLEMKLIHACRNTIPYLQNQTVTASVLVEKSDLNVSYVYPEIFKLASCSEEELGLDENKNVIEKVVCVCEKFLVDLETFLENIKSNLRTEDILVADSSYLRSQKQNLNSFDDEIGFKAGVLLNFLAELLPYSNYLQKYVCRNESMCAPEINLIDFQNIASRKRQIKQYFFLNMVLKIIIIAGEIRKSSFMPIFFCSTIKLLTNISKSRNYNWVNDIFCKLTKELILSRPSALIIRHISTLLKVASQHSSFVAFLFNKSRNSMSSRKGILYFNEDACRFYVFVMLFDNTIFKLKDFPLDVCLNMLCFMYNTFKTSHWIHHRDTKECECVPQLYKLEIEIVFKALAKYIEEVRRIGKKKKDWDHFFKNTITVKVLNLMTYNSYELTEKYITVYSQYKEIERILENEKHLCELENLNINEDAIEIASNAFVGVNF